MQLKEHVQEHMTIYLFMTMLFLTGVIFGAIIVNSMNFIQKQDLLFFLERFFGHIANDENVSSMTMLKTSFMFHLKYVLFIGVLGLSVIGLPVVWVLLFLKGLVVGFSVGFIVHQLGMKGFLLASASIAPQNIFIIPIYIIAGTVAMVFSLTMLRKLFSRTASSPMLQPFATYVTVFVLLIAVCICPALVETFISNEVMQSIIKSLY